MKKRILCTILLIVVVATSFVFAGCSKTEEKSFVVHYNNELGDKTYTGNVGKTLEIETYNREGYCLTGFYDAPEGGKMYFNNQGKSIDTNSIRTVDNPTYSGGSLTSDFPAHIYPQWKALTEMKVKTMVMFPNEYEKINKSSLFCFSFYETITVKDKKKDVEVDIPDVIIMNGILSTPNQKVKITIKFTAKDELAGTSAKTWTINLKNNFANKAEPVITKTVDITSEAKEYTLEFETTNATLSLNRLVLDIQRDNKIGKSGMITKIDTKIVFV